MSPLVLRKLGQSIVMAHQDKRKESDVAFAQAVGMIPQKQLQRQAMETLCFDYPAVGQAIAESVTRNADNAPKGEKQPSTVAWLRSPAGLLGGPK